MGTIEIDGKIIELHNVCAVSDYAYDNHVRIYADFKCRGDAYAIKTALNNGDFELVAKRHEGTK